MHRQLSREERIAVLAADLNKDLEASLNPAKLIDDDDPEKKRLIFNEELPLPLEKAIHFVPFMHNRILTRGLKAWLPAYVPEFYDPTKRRFIDSALRVIGVEKYFHSVRYSLRHLDEKISANKMARNTFAVKNPEHSKYRTQLLTEGAPDLKEVGLWIVEEIEDPRSYNIKAGPTLVDFNKHIYLYWAKRQAQFFGDYLK
jgi:hypothetical protein